jgi:hypothetical protein
MELLLAIYRKIVDCEGGIISHKISKKDTYCCEVVITMPQFRWCEECKARFTCRAKLLRRWGISPYFYESL